MRREKFIIFIAIAVGLCFIASAIHSANQTIEFISRATPVTGTVKELERVRMRSFSPAIEFNDEKSKKHTYYSNTSSNPPSFYVGEKVRLLVDFSDPNFSYNARIDRFWYLWVDTAATFIIGLLHVLISSAILWQGRKKSMHNKSLQRARPNRAV